MEAWQSKEKCVWRVTQQGRRQRGASEINTKVSSVKWMEASKVQLNVYKIMAEECLFCEPKQNNVSFQLKITFALKPILKSPSFVILNTHVCTKLCQQFYFHPKQQQKHATITLHWSLIETWNQYDFPPIPYFNFTLKKKKHTKIWSRFCTEDENDLTFHCEEAPPQDNNNQEANKQQDSNQS